MQIQINLDSANPGDMEKFLGLLNGFSPAVGLQQAIAFPDFQAASEAVGGPVSDPETTPAEPEHAAAEQPTRRTRRTKAEMESAKNAPPAHIEISENLIYKQPVVPTEPEVIPAETPVAIGIDDLRSALQAYTSVKGMPAGIDLLKKFGCSRISELAAQDEGTKRGFLHDAA